MIAQAPTTVTLVTEAPAIWQGLLVASIPALVALAVVFIGGKQNRDRLHEQLLEGRQQWQDQREFERQKFVMQERRSLYANLLSEHDHLGYLSMHALGHLGPRDTTDTGHDDEALQDWMEHHNRLNRLMVEARMLGSDDFVEIVKAIDSFWSEWFEPILDRDPAAAAEWHATEGEERPASVVYALHAAGVAQARQELNA